MKKKTLLTVFVVFLLINSGFKGGFVYDMSTSHFVRNFSYSKYIGENYGEFHRAFQSASDKKHVATICNKYQPRVTITEGIKFNVGHHYVVRAIFKTKHYLHISFDSTVVNCKDCLCPEYDTAKIERFEILKNNELIKTYQ